MVKDDILNDEGKKMYDELSKLIPGFHPGLDQMVLSLYVNLLQQQERLNKEIQEAEAEQKKEVLMGIKKENERQLQEIAEEMGLTPASRKEIERNLKLRKNQEG